MLADTRTTARKMMSERLWKWDNGAETWGASSVGEVLPSAG